MIHRRGDSAIEEVRRRIGGITFRSSELENKFDLDLDLDLDFTDLAT